MSRASLTLAFLFPVMTGSAAAQQTATPQRTTPAGIHYGKFAAGALAVGFTALGIRSHNGADRDFRDLVEYCRQQGCALATDGRYADPLAEARYRAVSHGDRTARALFLGAQAALATTVVLVVLELKGHQGTENIPYAPLLVEPGRLGTRIGLRLAW